MRALSRWHVWLLVGVALVGAACRKQSTRDATLVVSYFALGTPHEDGMPLRVTLGAGANARSVRGIEFMNRYPFLFSQEARLDSGVTMPVSVAMVDVPHDTLAQAQLTLGPVQPETRYTVGVTVSRERPKAFGKCGVSAAVAMRGAAVPDSAVRDSAAGDGGSAAAPESLFVSVVGLRKDGGC